MKHWEKVAPVAAVITALTTLACCLPIAFAAGAATAGLATVAGAYQPWFLGASLLMLASGALQLFRARRACRVKGTGTMIVLAVSTAIVLLVVLFPQVVAAVMADWMP